MKLVIATGNTHKLEEFARILTPLGIEALPPSAVGCSLDGVEETGATFAENARIKALALHSQCGLAVAADDSGLCIDALAGRPGVHSARYLGEDTPHTQKIAGILSELAGVPDARRTARFVAAICCVLPDGGPIECEGVCEGSIAHAPSGKDGFGYDPIFLVKGKSFGDLSPVEKDAVSHRGRALRELHARLTAWLEDNR